MSKVRNSLFWSLNRCLKVLGFIIHLVIIMGCQAEASQSLRQLADFVGGGDTENLNGLIKVIQVLSPRISSHSSTQISWFIVQCSLCSLRSIKKIDGSVNKVLFHVFNLKQSHLNPLCSPTYSVREELLNKPPVYWKPPQSIHLSLKNRFLSFFFPAAVKEMSKKRDFCEIN